ncbi:hypothetical protein [Absidia glauca]|uniref:Uncharacterized protein n=1 Tax=Absidia glauca TaxID=4829 RepID=A0A168N567_ABSGL|nr:hypothetical protein [Absidia glauca]
MTIGFVQDADFSLKKSSSRLDSFTRPVPGLNDPGYIYQTLLAPYMLNFTDQEFAQRIICKGNSEVATNPIALRMVTTTTNDERRRNERFATTMTTTLTMTTTVMTTRPLLYIAH